MRMKIIKKLFPSKKSQAKQFTRTRFGNFMLFFFLAAFGLFSMLPLIYSIVTSFKPIDELLVFPPTFFVKRPTTVNYIALSTLLSNLSVPLSRYIFNSLFVAIVTTVFNVLIASMAAFALCKGKILGKKVIFMVIQYALMFNATTLAVPRYLIFAKTNMIDTYWVYILPHFAATLGVFLVKQYMEGSVPEAFLEAARIDGAGYFRIFFRIVTPIIKPVWLTVALFTFRDVWAEIPAGTIFEEKLKTLPQIVTQITAGGTARAGSAMAVTTLMMIPPIVVYFISQSNVAEAMSSAGIKE